MDKILWAIPAGPLLASIPSLFAIIKVPPSHGTCSRRQRLTDHAISNSEFLCPAGSPIHYYKSQCVSSQYQTSMIQSCTSKQLQSICTCPSAFQSSLVKSSKRSDRCSAKILFNDHIHLLAPYFVFLSSIYSELSSLEEACICPHNVVVKQEFRV